MFLATLTPQFHVPCEPLGLIRLGMWQSTARLARHSLTSSKHNKYSSCAKLVTTQALLSLVQGGGSKRQSLSSRLHLPRGADPVKPEGQTQLLSCCQGCRHTGQQEDQRATSTRCVTLLFAFFSTPFHSRLDSLAFLSDYYGIPAHFKEK